jgi:hypothetical protein
MTRKERKMYLEQKHDNCEQNLRSLYQEVNAKRAKIELPIHLGHINQNWLAIKANQTC